MNKGEDEMVMESDDEIQVSEKPFKPKILALTCNWCGYAGIDIAGTMHMQYPASIRVVKVMCLGRIHPDIVLEAFARGADGVLIVGCQVGDCHYIRGNQFAEFRMEEMDAMLEGLGIDHRRLKLGFIFAYEGKKFANIVREFTMEIFRVGPNLIRIDT